MQIFWKNLRKIFGKPCKNIGQNLKKKLGENHGKVLKKSWKTLEKSLENIEIPL
jgi:hypothetical protein